MKAFFSCAGFHNYNELVTAKKQVQASINNALEDKVYGAIQFLTARFSNLNFIEPETPILRDGHTLWVVVGVEDASPIHFSQALVDGLKSEIVPKALQADIKDVLEKEGWL